MTTRPRPTRDRSDLLDLRTGTRQTEYLLTQLSAFEQDWLEFQANLSILVNHFVGKEWNPYEAGLPSETRETLAETDVLRLRLASRQSIVLPDYKDPLAHVLRTSLRRDEEAPTVTKLFGQTIYADPQTGRREYAVSYNEFSARMAECRAIIDQRRHELEALLTSQRLRIEEQERAIAEQHARDLAIAQARRTSFWAMLRASWVAKVAWWLFGEPLRAILVAILVFALAAILPTPVQKVVNTLILRLRPDSTASH